MKNSTRILCLFFIALGALNFGSFVIHSQQIGGDAVNGRRANGHFYVSNHGKETEVSQQQWNLSRWQAVSLIVTHPLAMGAMFLLILKHEFPKKMFRGSAQERAQTVQEICASGPLQTEFGCSGKIGPVNFSEGLLKVAIYPAGFICQLRFVSDFGLLSSEIESIEKQTSLLNSGIKIVHRSANVVSPILLRSRNAAAVAALLALTN